MDQGTFFIKISFAELPHPLSSSAVKSRKEAQLFQRRGAEGFIGTLGFVCGWIIAKECAFGLFLLGWSGGCSGKKNVVTEAIT